MEEIPLPAGFAWATQVQLGSPEVYRLSQLSWPRFLLEESDIPDPIVKFQLSARDFAERFHVYGIRNSAGTLVAFLEAVHVHVDLSRDELPDPGWRFSMQNAATGGPKNASSLVEASVDPSFRGAGLAKFLLARGKLEAGRQGFRTLIAPVRPSQKAAFPFESIAAYLARRTPDGRVHDSWLRAHLDAGARQLNVCHESARVEATLQRWREWTGLAFDTSGPLAIDGGLMPVEVDLAKGLGVYREPNVWVRYDLG